MFTLLVLCSSTVNIVALSNMKYQSWRKVKRQRLQQEGHLSWIQQDRQIDEVKVQDEFLAYKLQQHYKDGSFHDVGTHSQSAGTY